MSTTMQLKMMARTAHNRNIFFVRSHSYYQKDKRLLSSHKVYHIGRFFSLIGSAIFAFGLMCKFIFTEEVKSDIPVVTISVSAIGGFILLVGIGFLAWAVFKTQLAIMNHEKDKAKTNNASGSGGDSQNSNTTSANTITEIIATPHELNANDLDLNITINRTID